MNLHKLKTNAFICQLLYNLQLLARNQIQNVINVQALLNTMQLFLMGLNIHGRLLLYLGDLPKSHLSVGNTALTLKLRNQTRHLIQISFTDILSFITIKI